MIIELINEMNGLNVIFMTHSAFTLKYGYGQLLSNYPTFDGNTLVLPLNAHSGFTSNNQSRTETTSGIGANGGNLQSFSLSEKIVAIEFKNYYSPIEELGGLSVNQYLHVLLGDTLESASIKVIVNSTYTNYFYSTGNTNTEGMLIELATIEQDDGTLWRTGMRHFAYFYRKLYKPYVPKVMPSTELVVSKTYPYQLELISTSTSKPQIRVGGSMLGSWDSATITDGKSGKYVQIDNTIYGDEYIIIDSNELTVMNENGADRSDVVSGDIFLLLNTGMNAYDWMINGVTDDIHQLQYLPQDFRVEIDFEGRVQSVV